MRLRELLLQAHSRAQCDTIIRWIGKNLSRFDELVQLYLYDKDPRIIQGAAWPLSEIAIQNPGWVVPYLGRLLKYVKQPGLHEAVKRNTVRILQYITLPKKYHGQVMNLCFDYLLAPAEKPAVKAFSLTVLANLCTHYPEIKQELKIIIVDRWQQETAAFRSRGKKILQTLG